MAKQGIGIEPLLKQNEHNTDYNSLSSSDRHTSIKSDKIIEILQKHQIEINIQQDGDIDDSEPLNRLFDKYKYTETQLRNEICQAYEQNDDELQLIIYKILFKDANLGYKSRQAVYDIILHEYFELIDLNVNNIINITTTIIEQLKLDHIIDIYMFCEIIRKNKLKGAKINDLLHNSSSSFFDKFKALNVSSSALGKLFHTLTNWKPKDHWLVVKKMQMAQRYDIIEEVKYDDEHEQDSDDSDDHQIKENKDNDDQDQDDDNGNYQIKHCRNDEKDNSRDPLPKYIRKSVKNQ